jgi:N-acetylneuraminate synthase
MDRMVSVFNIGSQMIGSGQPCFIIAEAGVNHNGSPEMARQLIDAAVQTGADAVKFQTFKTELVMTHEAPKAGYQRETTGAGESQFDMVKRLELAPEVFGELMAYCQESGILFLSSPFDNESVDLLGDLEVAAFKVPSGEITNIPYLERISRKGRPMIVSTGMANLSEVDLAVQAIRNSGSPPFALLHCVSNYPADPSVVNLKAMGTMQTAFGVPVGYSDHTLGTEISIAAAALGASVIEKHITLDNNLPGPDHRASLEPNEFKNMVSSIRSVQTALGNGQKVPAASEADTASVARKSLIAARDIPAGTVLTEDLITIKRPGTGLPPSMMQYLLGRITKTNVSADSLLDLDKLE